MNETKVSRKSNRERERERESRSESFFVQNWSGEAMEEKEKEILDPRKVFSFFPGKVEWRGKWYPRKCFCVGVVWTCQKCVCFIK